MKEQNTVLQVNSSSRFAGSITRQVVSLITEQLLAAQLTSSLIDRELTKGIDFIDEAWIGANFTAQEERTTEQQSVLADSTSLVEEVFSAQHIVIGAPMYNFSIPALLKAWFDQIARANLTFKYTQTGPQGLLEGKKAYVVIASGGVPVGSDYDFSSSYLKQVLGFIGITDVTIIDANKIDLAGTDSAINDQLRLSLAEEQAA